MLEIRKTAVAFEGIDLIEIERIVIDGDKEEALRFLKKSVYARIVKSQHGRLKSHLDGESNPDDELKIMPANNNLQTQ
jgi:hypothetical protein